MNYVDRPCTYASRGGIVDVYCLEYDHPIRIEFLIQSLNQFESFMKKHKEPLKQLILYLLIQLLIYYLRMIR